MSSPSPVLEVGGTHVSAALVDPDGWTVSDAVRQPLDADAGADEILARLVSVALKLPAPAGSTWGVAMPDPFDYPKGIALFDAAVGKFGALHGVDVGAALRGGLHAEVAFLNDADAFALGEWTAGAAVGAARVCGLTLGTGVGSGWVVDGAVVDPGYPRNGRIHLVDVDGVPLEDVMSRRAIRRAFAAAGGAPSADVREIADLARTGDDRAAAVLERALGALGVAVGSVLAGFAADLLVVGGSMAASWDLFEPWLRAGAGTLPPVRVSADAERSGFVGAAVHALHP
ncbi:ROK family protein [uncultured Jatrophihabitans sp.]|uniref:ROK family protein n=1 Tax=uncultured Jatrophihabitans sp. TaxID=1610747 RepID=UPI0035C94FED